MAGIKKTNEYKQLIKNYDKIPKAILAAIVVSNLLNHVGTNQEEVTQAIADEWLTLYVNGIVPQKPLI